jgi:glucose/arabinose dehydrogenase
MQRHFGRRSRPGAAACLGTVACIGAPLLAPLRLAAQTVTDPLLQVTTYACCPEVPTSFAFLPGSGPVDLLVLEKFTGRVRHYRDGVLQGIALDLPVASYGERGLLGIAVHPDFASNGFVYLDYSASPTPQDAGTPSEILDNRVERYTWNGSALVAPQPILTLPSRPAFFHIGGVIHFGPDGMLYGVIGDVGRFGAGQLQNNATGAPPDTTSIVFRVQDDGAPPLDNPFYAMGGAMQFVWAYGLRNSFGFDFDPRSGDLWESDNGPSDYDEINRFPAGSNGGWSDLWGPESRSPGATAGLWVAPGSQYADPQFSWLTSVAPTAVHFARSDSLGPATRNDLLVGVFNSPSQIFRFELDAGRAQLVMPDATLDDRVADTAAEVDLVVWGTGFGGVTDMETGPDGALYVASYFHERIYRIGPAPLSAAGPGLPGGLVAAPNPFRTRTSFRFTGTEPPQLLHLYTAAGWLVRTLHGETTWDGRDAQGRQVPAGVYFVRLALPPGRAVEASIVRIE